MKRYKTETKIYNHKQSEICDSCGKEYFYDRLGDIYELQEFFHIDRVGGYGSIFGDEDRLKLDICQHCFKEMLESKINNLIDYIKFCGDEDDETN
jgi:hypothetical protein